jgi:NTP pyrophosphatase (non-canonical NTP hydrolase)
MKLNFNFNELATKIHENAKAKGFYDNIDENHFGKFLNHQIYEVVKEIAEFHEAYKKGISTPSTAYTDIVLLKDPTMFRMIVKDTYQDELADAIIRILDIAKYMDYDLLEEFDVYEEPELSNYDISGICLDITMALSEQLLNDALDNIFYLAHNMNIDILWHIEAKMDYNTTREKLHGKKF